MTTSISLERADTPDAVLLIEELETHLAPLYPATSRYGYSVEKLIKEGVAFFVIRQDGIPAGCGGVQFFGLEYGELKRMFVRSQFRGLGLARLMLNHLEDYTREHSINLLLLETGIHQKEAIGLYESAGYKICPPFGEYTASPLNMFFEKKIVKLEGANMIGNKTPPKNMDEYIAGFPGDIQKVLKKIRTTIKAAAPDAEEKISYQMPTFFLNGNLVHFAAFKNHIGFYPAPSGIEKFKKELSVYKGAKGSVQFPLDQPMPYGLITKIVKFRVKENLEKAKK